MGFAQWLGLSTQKRADEPPPSDPSTAVVPPSRSSSPRGVSVAEALGVSMVYRAVSILAIATKQMSLDVYRGSTIIEPAPLLVRQPDPDETRSAFLEQTVVSLATSGNAYWRIGRNDAGGPLSLTVLNPLDIEPVVNSSGRVLKYSDRGNDLQINEVKHLKLLRVPGSPKGLGPIQAAQPELRGAIDTRDYASNWFTGSGVPAGGYLGTDQALNADIAKQTRDSWTAATADREGVPVLGNGVKFVQTFLTPTDALWIEGQQFNVTQVARLFGVPSSLMLATVEGNTQTYQNVSQDWLGFVRFSLMQYLKEIEEALSTLLPRGQDAHFNVEALLRSDITTRYAAHAIALAGEPWMTVPEVRGIENLPPLIDPPREASA